MSQLKDVTTMGEKLIINNYTKSLLFTHCSLCMVHALCGSVQTSFDMGLDLGMECRPEPN